MATLMNDVGSFLSPDLLSRLGGAIGESPDTASRAAHAGLPALVDGLRDVARTEGGGARILEVIRGKHYDEPGALSRIESISRDPSATAQLAPEGQGVLRSIFGGHLDGVVSRLHQSSGVDRPAIGGMLALLAPVVLGVLGKRAREGQLDGRGITKLLNDERSIGIGAIDTGVETHEANRVHVFDRPERRATAAVPTREEHKRPNWLLPLLALGLLALALFFLFRGRDDDRRAVVVPETRVEEPAPATTPVVPYERESAGKPEAAGPTTADVGGEQTERTDTTQQLVAPGVEQGAIEQGAIEQGAIEQGAIEQGAIEQGAIEQGAVPGGEPLAQEDVEPMAEETIVEEEVIAAPEGGIDAFAVALTTEDQTLPARFVVDDLQFASGAVRLGTDVESIDRLAELLEQSPEARIRLDGHSDSNGSSELNRDLSLARADAVRAALVERGIEEDRIETSGEGEDQPIASNDTEEGQRQNRRTEVVLLER